MLNYQDALYTDRVLPGERDCAARWDLIAPHVPQHGMILDVGSNLGYFGLRATQNSESLGVVSIESDWTIAQRQRQLLAAHGVTRVCLINGLVSSVVTGHWVEACDWFDVTLLLSVLHWFDDPAKVVRDLSRMSARLVAEVPDPLDAGACGQDKIQAWADPLKWFLDTTGRKCSLLGRVSRHTSAHPSHLILVEGPVERRSSRAYWKSSFIHPLGNEYHMAYDGQNLKMAIRGQEIDYVPGVNLVSLTKLGRLVWPPPEHWLGCGTAAFRTSPRHLDPLPHNMLWTPHGVELIDADDRKGDAQGRHALGMFKDTILAWWRNRTAQEAYVPQLPPWRRPLRSCRRLIGAAYRMLLRGRDTRATRG